ncbi:MAG: 30S ribosomal protein S15 [Thermoplasmata archaeon]|nr:30S ribosomal protein S15 [Thermoplasmata archaeon]
MARMHRRTKGKSSSTRPHLEKPPAWAGTQPKEVEKLVNKLHREGLQSAQIGIRLRDQYGIPSVKLLTGKPITQILQEGGAELQVPEDLGNLLTKALRLTAHLAEHHRDVHNRRSLELIEAKIRRLARYYKREGVLPEGWVYRRSATELQTR